MYYVTCKCIYMRKIKFHTSLINEGTEKYRKVKQLAKVTQLVYIVELGLKPSTICFSVCTFNCSILPLKNSADCFLLY